jgi:hypothetical protein
MRKWLGWAFLGGFAVFSTAAGCGGGGSDTGTFGDDDAAPAEDANTTGQDATSGDDGGGPHLDATTGSDTSTGPVDASGGLDILIPDGGFTSPDSSAVGPMADSGPDVNIGCGPNSIICSGSTATICSSGNTSTTTCSGTTPLCANGYGCVACQPGAASCNGNTSVVCKSDGSGTTSTACSTSTGETCMNGFCAGDCANLGSSYIGCEYYAVTMPNSLLSQGTFPFAISVSNTSLTKPVTVAITGPASFTGGGTIAAGGIAQYVLPWVSSLSNGNAATQDVVGGAYHILTNEPVTVYQFNARDYTLNGAFSYTNDASLLLPVNAMTANYYVVTGATWDVYTGNVAVIATQDGTTVSYTAPGGNAIIAGGNLTATGGTSAVLNHGDVLQISAAANGGASTFGSDQSGAHVTANAPIEVFGGVDCTNMPASVQYCDHIEEVVFPVETLRGDYLVVRPQNDYATPRQYVKIVGTVAGTTLTYDPAIAGAPTTLTAGQTSFFEATVDFHVTASHPVIVGQFMESENNFGATCVNSGDETNKCGDPAQSVAVATAQFRTSYQFIAPPTYEENYVSIIAPTGATVTVDGTNYTSGTAIGGSGYWVKPVAICAGTGCTGVHTATGTAGFGIQVYGYGAYTSYMYPGGLNLTRQ